jgi:hypothetical protein
MTLGTLLMLALILLLFGAFPVWPHSRSWGYYPSGGISFALVVVIVLILVIRI